MQIIQTPKNLFFTFTFLTLAITNFAHADSQEIEDIKDIKLPGDGETPTFLQYLDSQGHDIKPSQDLLSSTSKGDVSYSFKIELPPAIMQPGLTLSYSSAGGANREMAYGWSLNGIAEINKPLNRAYKFNPDEPWDNEWLVSGADFGGTLYPSDEDDYWFYLASSKPGFVSAHYLYNQNIWNIHSNGIRWILSAVDDGEAPTGTGTALWRTVEQKDNAGNRITYTYHDDGRIKAICYGGNGKTGAKHLAAVEFLYAPNSSVRTSYRAGYLQKQAYHITKIGIRSFDGSPFACGSELPQNGVESGDYFAGQAWKVYELIHTTVDKVDLLTKIQVTGYSDAGSQSEVIASFQYSQFDPDRPPTKAQMWSQDRYYSHSGSKDGTNGVYSETVASLIDFNRDGLPDLINASRAISEEDSWAISPLTINGGRGPNARFEFDDGHFIEGIDDSSLYGMRTPGTTINYKTVTSIGMPATQTGTIRQLIDIDSDGYPDLLVSNSESYWYVFPGRGKNSDFATAEDLQAPCGFKHAQVKYSVDASYDTAQTFTKDVETTLVDLNGDGYLDAYDPAQGKVCYHTGDIALGWQAPTTINRQFEAFRSVNYTIVNADFYIDVSDYCNDICSDDEDGDCLSECQDEIKVDKNRIKYSRETGAFYDMNGDGLVDYVDAHTTPWQVYFNNGKGFEDPVEWSARFPYIRIVDEGEPEIEWESNMMGANELVPGSPAKVLQILVDVDGDGLQDLASITATEGKVWYKNTGSGFSLQKRNLPNWWPDAFTLSNAKSIIDADHPSRQKSASYTTEMLIDLNNDGMLDYLYGNGVKYGQYPKPYLLTKVDNEQGGQTTVSYLPSSHAFPSGDYSKVQNNPQARHLVHRIFSKDNLTGENSLQISSYRNGFAKDGVFHGFQWRNVTQKLNGNWIGRTAYTYELHRDYDPLELTKNVYVDGNLSFGKTIKKGNAKAKRRFFVRNIYNDYGEWAKYRLLNRRTVTEYGEVTGQTSYTKFYYWDGYGNLTWYKHNGGNNPNDMKSVGFGYTSDVVNDGPQKTFFRINQKVARGVDPITGSKGVFSKELFFYDDNTGINDPLTSGLLTKSIQFAGWPEGGEKINRDRLVIKYGRDDRGALAFAQDVNTGIRIDQSFGFGGAVLKTQTNNLGHSSIRTIDDRGRIISVQDPNQMSINTSFDGLDRPIQKTVTGTDGSSHQLKSWDYQNSSAPNYTVENIYNDHGVDNTIYSVEDGFGHVAESWQKNAAGDFVATTSLYDLRGDLVVKTHPSLKGKTFSTPSSFAVTNPLEETYYDALGTVREKIRDAKLGTGSITTAFDQPRINVVTDEAGYQKRFTKDVHGRLIQVEEGKSGSFTTTAKYNYDPLDRLIRFEDGTGVYYHYSYDLAGRLRQVRRGITASGKENIWYTYKYKGGLRTQMIDADGLTVSWNYDATGRVTKISATDSLPDATGPLVYTNTWDTNFIGQISESTDPAGTTAFQYDPFGRPTGIERVFNANNATGKETQLAFKYKYDLRGNVIQKDLPSGRVVNNDYKHGFLTTEEVLIGGKQDYKLAYTYNLWNLVEKIQSSHGFERINDYTTPLWINSIKQTKDSAVYTRQYHWEGNGLLKTKTEVSGSLKNTYAYQYDNLQQISKVQAGKTLMEAYLFDGAGNPIASKEMDGTSWRYSTSDPYHQISYRESSQKGREEYTYDKTGRIKTWRSKQGLQTNYYDGFGRLRGWSINGSWKEVLDYDINGQLVRLGDNNPHTSTPYYKYSFDSWRLDEKSGVLTELDNLMVTYENKARLWNFKEFDGHAAATFSDDGRLTSLRSLGVFGAVYLEKGRGSKWHSYHGSEEQGNMIHMGQRHLMKGWGQWLQPEPMLYLGIPSEYLSKPLSLAAYRYAMNAPTTYQDPSGFSVEVYQDDEKLESAGDITPQEDSPINEAIQMAKDGKSPDEIKDFLEQNYQGINPSNNGENCGSKTAAFALRLAGEENITAKPDKANSSELASFFGQTGQDWLAPNENTMASLADELQNMGSGAQAAGIRVHPGKASHIFNLVNIEGEVYAINADNKHNVNRITYSGSRQTDPIGYLPIYDPNNYTSE